MQLHLEKQMVWKFRKSLKNKIKNYTLRTYIEKNTKTVIHI